jgi:hydroxymethylglutaryl-CoA lyase
MCSEVTSNDRAVVICEMSARDGMQILNRENRIPLALRVRLVAVLEQAGFEYIEVGSFVSPKYMPAMKDTAELVRAIPPSDRQLAALVPNLKYYDSLRSGHFERNRLNTVALFVAVSEEYSRKNLGKSVSEAMVEARAVAEAARRDGYRLRAHLSTAFRELDGGAEIAANSVLARCRELLDMGCEHVALADTDGRASPADMTRVLTAVGGEIGLDGIGVHLHDRYGFGLANAYAAFQAGVRRFDSAIGGIGGNRIVRHSVGNIATEELAAMFERVGVRTGLNIPAIHEALKIVHEMTRLAGDPAPSGKYFADLVNTGELGLAE